MSKFVSVKRVMSDMEGLSTSAAYALMHQLGAVHVGTRSLRLPESAWLRYTAALCRTSDRAAENTLQSVTTSTVQNDNASSEVQASSSTVARKRSEQPSASHGISKLHSQLAKVAERAAHPSDAPTKRSLIERLSRVDR